MKAKAMGLQKDGKTGVPVWHKSENRKNRSCFPGKVRQERGKSNVK